MKETKLGGYIIEQNFLVSSVDYSSVRSLHADQVREEARAWLEDRVASCGRGLAFLMDLDWGSETCSGNRNVPTGL